MTLEGASVRQCLGWQDLTGPWKEGSRENSGPGDPALLGNVPEQDC